MRLDLMNLVGRNIIRTGKKKTRIHSLLCGEKQDRARFNGGNFPFEVRGKNRFIIQFFQFSKKGATAMYDAW
jgi:hypothetical protein